LSILQWADYILQQDANLETASEKKQDLECLKIDQYQMITNAIKWRITDDKDTDETHHQVTSPSKENKVNYDCLKDKSLTLLKNMTEVLDVYKRYYEQLKQKTYDQKQVKNKITIRCASLVKYMKKELQADAELDWNALLEWVSGQAKLEMFERDNDIDDNNTSKQNNDVSGNNKEGTQNMSEEEDRGKVFNDSSSSDDNEDDNQSDDDRDDANKEKVKRSIWEV
jgi:hypothetical protein